jgi:hypothetical protein
MMGQRFFWMSIDRIGAPCGAQSLLKEGKK